MDQPKYKRVLIKISGEALAGDKHFGLDFQVMGRVAEVIRECVDMGVQVGVVIGGGNFWRGVKDGAGNIKDRITETTTTTGKEMVNGVATTFKQVETKVNGTVTKVTKTYDDMSKTLLGTFTNVSETTFNGITTKVQQAVEKYADGSEHIKKNVTETGQRIGENGAETYEKIITYIDGIQDKVTETSTLIDKSVKGTQNRIDQQLSEASGQLDKGIFGLVKNTFKDAKNGDWASLGLDFVNLIWGEVSQGQRDVISKWLTDALTAVNEGYFSGGIGKAFDIFQKLYEAKMKSTQTKDGKSAQNTGAKENDDTQVPDVNLIRLYEFDTLDDVIAAAHGLNGYFTGTNTLYKDPADELYKLVLHQSSLSPEDFNRVCNILTEYGQGKAFSLSGEAYLTEHGELISDSALQQLIQL